MTAYWNFIAYSDRVRDVAYHVRSQVTSGAQLDRAYYTNLYTELLTELPEEWRKAIEAHANPSDGVAHLVRTVEKELLKSGSKPERIETFSALLRLGLLLERIERRIAESK
jgi:hypothetical protein